MKTGRNLFQIWLLFVASGVHAQSYVYDQQSSVTGLVGAGPVIQLTQPMGQSFTPAFSNVSFVQLAFWDYPFGSITGLESTVYVNLWSGSIGNGTLLASSDPVTIAAAANNLVVSFFFRAPVPVTPGSTYFFQPIVQSGDTNRMSVGGITYHDGNYPGGTLYLFDAPDSLNRDLWFREGILMNIPLLTCNPLTAARSGHTATLLSDGKVIVVSGTSSTGVTNSAELFDPSSGVWVNTGILGTARQHHTATSLPNGKVLVTGGDDGNGHTLASVELFNPASQTWSAINPLNTARSGHTATLLSNGQVLVAGGLGSGGVTNTAEIFEPVSAMWTAINSLNIPRTGHTATLLPDGRVLVSGGVDTNGIPLASAEIYDPASAMWTVVGNPMNSARTCHTATLLPNGLVLIVGGTADGVNPLASAELFDPTNRTWTLTETPNTARKQHTATLLSIGTVLVVGGLDGSSNALTSAELFNPVNGTWRTTFSSLASARGNDTATMLANGQVLFVGGIDSSGNLLASAELFDPTVNPNRGKWTKTGALNTPRACHTATLLPNGRVLVVGGVTNTLHPFVAPFSISSAEIYNPSTATWTNANTMTTARAYHTATLLPNGMVLIAGGADINGPTNGTELFSNGIWMLTGSMNVPRERHTATLLRNGKVMVAGGTTNNNGQVTAIAELYDPSLGTWTLTGPMNIQRFNQTATLLPNGQVLVAGGGSHIDESGYLPSAELFDPSTGAWTMTDSMNYARNYHTATLLPDGQVLVAGGYENPRAITAAELYDPVTGIWTNTSAMFKSRSDQTATLLPNGQVLVAAGGTSFGSQYPITGSEIYDPATGIWSATNALNFARAIHTATLLLDGRVLVAGGADSNENALTNVELYDVGLGYTNLWQPQIAAVTSPINLGGGLVVTGAQFRGIGEGSGGNSQDSSADYPVLQLRSLESGQTLFLLASNWSANSFVSTPVTGFPPGYALATMFVNGIQSTSSIVNISVPVPAMTPLTVAPTPADGSFQFTFTNTPGVLLGVLMTTDLSLPMASWTRFSGVTEISPGQFQFNDPQATNGGQRFYSIFAP